MRDFRLNNINWKANGYDWIADGMSAINAWLAFETKTRTVTVCNHFARYPCDLIELFAVGYKGMPLPLGKNLRGIHTSKNILTCNDIQNDLFNYEKLKEMNYKVQRVTDLQEIYEANPDPEILDEIIQLNKEIGQYSIPYATNYRNNYGLEYYNLNKPGGLETTFESGCIEMTFIGAVSDEEGLPLIPDNYEFKEALSWFIISRLLSGGYTHPVHTYQFADAKWEHFKKAARNKMKMPSVDSMRAFANMWTRPTFDRFMPDSFFAFSERGADIR